MVVVKQIGTTFLSCLIIIILIIVLVSSSRDSGDPSRQGLPESPQGSGVLHPGGTQRANLDPGGGGQSIWGAATGGA